MKTIAALAVLLGLMAAPSLADDAPPQKAEFTQVMKLWDSTLVFPPPSWVGNPQDAVSGASSAINRQQKDNAFLFEMVPKAEGFEKWTRIYGVIARNSLTSSPEDFEKEVFGIYSKACKDLKGEKIPGNRKGLFFVLYCGSYVADPAHGQIGAFRIVQRGTTTVRVYHEWRGMSFVAGTSQGLPVPAAELEGMVRRLSSVELGPAIK